MRSALDYIVSTPRDPLNGRVLGLYYGTMALAQAEMLASPSGPTDLDKVEAMTLYGHGLYTLAVSKAVADLHVGVLANGFFPRWMEFLGHDISRYRDKRPKSAAALKNVPADMVCLLQDLFASMPEIDDLFAEVFGGPARMDRCRIRPSANGRRSARKVSSTYGLFLDSSGKVSVDSLHSAGWPIAEIRPRNRQRGHGKRVSRPRGSRRP